MIDENQWQPVQSALDAMTETRYVLGEDEKADLDTALEILIRAYNRQDRQPGEEAEWQTDGQVEIGGQQAGAWRITLQRTDLG